MNNNNANDKCQILFDIKKKLEIDKLNKKEKKE